jgi:hypothetical protein
VECRTPLATLRHLFLTPARKCGGGKIWGQKKLKWSKKEKFLEANNFFVGRCRIPSQNVALKNLNAT